MPTTDREVLVSQLGVEQHPPPTMLLSQLRPRPQDEKVASQWFECLADCIPSGHLPVFVSLAAQAPIPGFSEDHFSELSRMQIVPTKSSGHLQWVFPTQCYLSKPKDEFIRNLFIFVDFGENANRFLNACGSKNEPSVRDVVESLIDDPERFYELAGGPQGCVEH